MRNLLLVVSVFMFASCVAQRPPIVNGIMSGFKSRNQAIKAIGCHPCNVETLYCTKDEPIIMYHDTCFFVHRTIKGSRTRKGPWYIHVIDNKLLMEMVDGPFIKTRRL